MTAKTYFLVLAVVICGGVGLIVVQGRRYPLQENAATNAEPGSWSVDVAGVTTPDFVTADDAKLGDDALIIGVSVGGADRAYLVDAMSASGIPMDGGPEIQRVRRHVVNDVLQGRAISVTYCDVSKCAEVYQREDSASEELRVGGFRDGKLILLHGGDRFPQGSNSAPFKTIPHVLTRWGDWKADHPDTTVYVGEAMPRFSD